MKGHIKKRGKNSYSIVIDLGKDAAGKRKQKWYTVQGTKRQAEQELGKLLGQLANGTYVPTERITVREFLMKWLEGHARRTVSPKTYERYAEICERHLIPALGQHPLNKLTALHIEAYYGQALVDGSLRGGALSPQTVLHHHRVLRSALDRAVKWQLIGRNPADAVEPPKPDRKQMRALDEAESHKLLEAAKGTRLWVPILVALTTGMRRGELLALGWDSLDFNDETLSVVRSLEQTRAGGLRMKPPKTKKSRRKIKLPDATVRALRRHRIEQNKYRLQAGSDYADHGLVFPRCDGEPWSPDAFTRAFGKLVRTTNLGHLRFQDLRHTHATQLLRQGVHPKIVSERLGHSSISITLDTYSHVLPGMQDEAAALTDAVLRAAVDSEE